MCVQLSPTKRASEKSLHRTIYLTLIIFLFMMFSLLNPMKKHIMGFDCSLFEWIGQWRNNVKKVFPQLKEVYLRSVCGRTQQPLAVKFGQDEKSFNIIAYCLSEILEIYRKIFIMITEIKMWLSTILSQFDQHILLQKQSFLKKGL